MESIGDYYAFILNDPELRQGLSFWCRCDRPDECHVWLLAKVPQ